MRGEDVKVGDIVQFRLDEKNECSGVGIVMEVNDEAITFPVWVRMVATNWTNETKAPLRYSEIVAVVKP